MSTGVNVYEQRAKDLGPWACWYPILPMDKLEKFRPAGGPARPDTAKEYGHCWYFMLNDIQELVRQPAGM